MLPERAPRLGLGAMRLASGARSVDLLLEALRSGVRLVDTADVYAPDPSSIGDNERLVARALEAYEGDRSEILVATKGGLRRQGKKWIPDGRARHLESACDASLRALGVESIDLYQLHALDPKVPAATSFRALESLRRKGKIRRVGLSNVGLTELELASDIVPIATVQVALSPLRTSALKNGLAEHCARHGMTLLAHSPLGGHRQRGKLLLSKPLRAVAERHGATVEEVALAWLLALHPSIVPLAGATRLESLRSSLRALELRLTAADLAELDRAWPETRALREPRAARAPDPRSSRGEVVVFVGYPGAGKSTLAGQWTSRGYTRLNRDERGGTLRGLVPELERLLAAGRDRIVLDNTYPRRESRFDVVETAWRFGVPVRAVWLETSLEDAQVNVVQRMLDRHGRLLSPEEMKRDPTAVPPDALFRFRRDLEPPRPDEGFVAVERRPFERRPAGEAAPNRGLFVPVDEHLPALRASLARYVERGFRLVAATYEPRVGLSEITAEEVEERHADLRARLGLPIEILFCPHPPGPPVCWCRKPLPGLGVVLIRAHALDPARSLVVASSAADRGFAERLGIPVLPRERLAAGAESG